MKTATPVLPSPPAQTASATNLFDNRKPTAERIALSGVLSCIAVAATLNVGFAFELGSAHSQITGAAFALGAVAATILASTMLSVALSAASYWQPARFAAALALWLAAVAFSALSAVGAASLARSDFTAERTAGQTSRALTLAEHSRLTAELASLPAARPAAELQGEIARILAADRRLAGCDAQWLPTTRLRDRCITLANLKAEAARAERRATIESRLTVLASTLATAEPERSADPQSEALASYANALGANLTADRLSPWLALAPALFFELAAALGFVAIGRQSPKPLERQQHAATQPGLALPSGLNASSKPVGGEPTSTAVAPPLSEPPAPSNSAPIAEPLAVAAPVEDQSPAAVAMPDDAEPMSREQLADRLRLHLIASGGEVRTSQRGLARLIGTSAPTLNRVIAGLSTAGVLIASTGPDGTVLRLAAYPI